MMGSQKSVLWLLLLLLCGGCAGKTGLSSNGPDVPAGEDRLPLIGVSFPTTSLDFRKAMYHLLEEYAVQEDRKADLILLDGENSQRKQNQDLISLVDQPVDGIILIPYTMEGPIPAIQYANDQGVPVLTLDNRIEVASSAFTVGYVGADHYLMGLQAGELLVASLEEYFPDAELWNVVYLTGIPNSSGEVDRNTGIQQAISQNSRIQLLGEYNGAFTSIYAQSILDDCLNIYPDLHGVICQNDLMAEGCYLALEDHGLAGEVVVIGIDGQRSVVEKITQGNIAGTVIQYPSMVLQAIDDMCAFLQGEKLSYYNYQPTDPITRENAQEYLNQELPW